MTDVRVTGVSTDGSMAGDRPTERVSLSHGTFFQSYHGQNQDGTLGTLFAGGWDLVRNMMLGTPTC